MKRLTEAQAKQYADEGCTHPVRVFSAEKAAYYLSCLESGERSMGAEFKKVLRTKAHLSLKWVDEVIHDSNVLDAVEDVSGPDILLYNLTVFHHINLIGITNR